MPHYGEPMPEGPGKHRYCRITTGQYTGDGTAAQSITGVGFQPKYVVIWIRKEEETPDITHLRWEKSDTMFGTICCKLGNTIHDLNADQIMSLDEDGFTVNVNGLGGPNVADTVYDFMALG